MSEKTFSVRSNAVRAARAALGKSAKQGIDFVINGEKGSYTFSRLAEASVGVSTVAPVDFEDVLDLVASTDRPPAENPVPVPVPAPAKAAVRKVKAAKVTKPVTKYLKKRKGADDVSGKRRKLVKLITSPKGASLDTITKVLGWQKHTVRGAISTLVSDKVVKNLKSERHDRRGRVYHAVAA